MSLPGFTATASLFEPTQPYRVQSSVPAPSAAIAPSLVPVAIRRTSIGVSYPPTGGGCQICDCTCYPIPC